MKTKKGFGGILKSGIDCMIIKNFDSGKCAIKTNNGDIYHGNLSDLEIDTINFWHDFFVLRELDLLDNFM
jgi:hypothetical protein